MYFSIPNMSSPYIYSPSNPLSRTQSGNKTSLRDSEIHISHQGNWVM